MCEFCLFPTSGDRDVQHKDFAGFFSPDAINAAVQQANVERRTANDDEDEDEDSDDDTDGT